MDFDENITFNFYLKEKKRHRYEAEKNLCIILPRKYMTI